MFFGLIFYLGLFLLVVVSWLLTAWLIKLSLSKLSRQSAYSQPEGFDRAWKAVFIAYALGSTIRQVLSVLISGRTQLISLLSGSSSIIEVLSIQVLSYAISIGCLLLLLPRPQDLSRIIFFVVLVAIVIGVAMLQVAATLVWSVFMFNLAI